MITVQLANICSMFLCMATVTEIIRLFLDLLGNYWIFPLYAYHPSAKTRENFTFSSLPKIVFNAGNMHVFEIPAEVVIHTTRRKTKRQPPPFLPAQLRCEHS
jgi:hypothetical protein